MADRSSQGVAGAGWAASADKPEVPPAQITLLYESSDGRLCLFQDAEGHLSAVRSDMLA